MNKLELDKFIMYYFKVVHMQKAGDEMIPSEKFKTDTEAVV